MTTSPLTDAFIPANASHQGGANGRITRVVIHATVSPCRTGGARGNARYFQSATAGGAAHYVVDPAEIIGCVDEDRVAHHAPPNTGSIGVELCDPQAGDGDRWNDQPHTLMLARAAALVADICTRHTLPVQWLTPTQLLAGDAGITSHRNVALAWRKTDHTDPGPDFPTDLFIAAVGGHAGATPSTNDEELTVANIDAILTAIQVSEDRIIGEIHKVSDEKSPIIQEVRKVPGWVDELSKKP